MKEKRRRRLEAEGKEWTPTMSKERIKYITMSKKLAAQRRSKGDYRDGRKHRKDSDWIPIKTAANIPADAELMTKEVRREYYVRKQQRAGSSHSQEDVNGSKTETRRRGRPQQASAACHSETSSLVDDNSVHATAKRKCFDSSPSLNSNFSDVTLENINLLPRSHTTNSEMCSSDNYSHQQHSQHHQHQQHAQQQHHAHSSSIVSSFYQNQQDYATSFANSFLTPFVNRSTTMSSEYAHQQSDGSGSGPSRGTSGGGGSGSYANLSAGHLHLAQDISHFHSLQRGLMGTQATNSASASSTSTSTPSSSAQNLRNALNYNVSHH